MDAIQKKLMKTLASLRDDNIDLKETPALFTWSYPEEPWIEFELLIRETDQSSFTFGHMTEETAH